jgi:transposase-like protein
LVALSDGAAIMPKRYPPEFRRRVLDLLEAGKKVAEVSRVLGISNQTVYNWRRQERIDRGLAPGTTTMESAELREARRRIAQLEAELAAAKRANELLQRTVSPKGGSRRSR